MNLRWIVWLAPWIRPSDSSSSGTYGQRRDALISVMDRLEMLSSRGEQTSSRPELANTTGSGPLPCEGCAAATMGCKHALAARHTGVSTDTGVRPEWRSPLDDEGDLDRPGLLPADLDQMRDECDAHHIDHPLEIHESGDPSARREHALGQRPLDHVDGR